MALVFAEAACFAFGCCLPLLALIAAAAAWLYHSVLSCSEAADAAVRSLVLTRKRCCVDI